MKNVYNRYIPQSDGSFQKNRLPEKRQPPTQHKQEQENPSPKPQDAVQIPAYNQNNNVSVFLKNLLPRNFDTGDLLIILLLLLMAGDREEEKSNALLTLAFYFFL